MTKEPASTPDETTLLLTGAATFVADVQDPLLGDAAHAVFVRSQSAHARIHVDADDARQAPGVCSVVTAADHGIRPTTAFTPQYSDRFIQPLLAEGVVRFVGEPIAVVVAESRAVALDAAELVVVEYEDLPTVLSVADALDDTRALFPATPRVSEPPIGRPLNVLRTHEDDEIGGTHQLAQFEDAEVVIRQSFDNPRQLAAPIECRGMAVTWTPDGEMHAWMSTQIPHGFRARLAPLYGLSLSQIHLIAGPFVGGGFGGKGGPGTEEQILPEVARQLGRPVRWIEDRGENLVAAPHGRSEEIEFWLAGTREGTFTAARAILHKDAGAYPSSGAGLPNVWTAPMVAGTYKIPHTEFEQITFVSNRPPVSALRGAGRAPVIAALERSVDLFAAEIGMDPGELRRRNLVTADSMPYTSPTGAVYDDADYVAALDRLLLKSDYAQLRQEQAERRTQGSPSAMGIGLASYNHRTCGGSGSESALVRINPDGSATVVTGTTSQGQGHQATWRKIASSELGISAEHIEVIEGDTDAISTGVGAVGSRSLQTAGLAIHEASASVVADAKDLAAQMLEAALADMVFDRAEATFHVAGTPGRALTWAELATEVAARDEQLSCDHVYNNSGRDVFPSGCHLAVVDVDTATGHWTLRRFVGVDDAGVRVDSDIVDGQLHGGIALGVAQVLGEIASYSDVGQPLSGSFLDYQILSIDQMCDLELHAQVVPSSFNAGGYKAVGESGPIGATPAVHNAVIDALAPFGIDHLDLPCTPLRVWEAIRRSG